MEGIDILDPGLFADGPPHELFAQMRREAPVRWNRTRDGEGFWSVTRHEDVTAVSKDNATFSSHEKGIFMNPDQVVPLDLARNLLLYMDPPPHTKYRKVMQTAFVPRTVAKMEDAIRARVTRVIDAIAADGEADFVDDVAVPVPLGVLAEMMGLPDADMDRLFAWTERIEQAQLDAEGGTALPVFTEMGGYLNEQIAAQAEAGGDSLVMRLKEGQVDDRPLDDNEILVFFALLVFAGNDTTRNTASSGLLALPAPPRPVGPAVPRAGADPGRGRGDPALDLGGQLLLPHGHRGHRARRSEDRRRRPGDDVVRVRLPRRGRRIGSRSLRHHPRRRRPQGVRRWRAPLLPGRRAGPAGAAHPVRGADPPPADAGAGRRARAVVVGVGELADEAADQV